MSTAATELPYAPEECFNNPLVEITQSSISTYMSCEQKFVFRYLLWLVPDKREVALTLGAAVHDCFEYMLDPSNKDDNGTRIAKCRQIVHRVFDEALEDAASWGADLDKMNRGRAQAAAMIEAWFTINGDYTDYFTVVQPEMNIRSKEGATINSPLGDRLAGKIDGLVVDLDQFEFWILEHKTRYSLQDMSFLQMLDLNHQVLFYRWLYEAWLKRDKGSNRKRLIDLTVKGAKIEKEKAKNIVDAPSGFYYDVISKPQHRTGDTFDELRDRMHSAMVQDPNKYFSFTPIPLKPELIERSQANFVRWIEQMDHLSAGSVKMNLESCDKYNGCPYRALCLAGADANDPASVFDMPEMSGYHIEAPHGELSEEE